MKYTRPLLFRKTAFSANILVFPLFFQKNLRTDDDSFSILWFYLFVLIFFPDIRRILLFSFSSFLPFFDCMIFIDIRAADTYNVHIQVSLDLLRIIQEVYDESSDVLRHSDSFSWNLSGLCLRFSCKKWSEWPTLSDLHRLRRRRHDRRLRIESSDPVDGAVRFHGKAILPPGAYRFLDWRPLPPASGSCHLWKYRAGIVEHITEKEPPAQVRSLVPRCAEGSHSS